MVARLLVATLLLSGSLLVTPENAGAGYIASYSLAETGQESSAESFAFVVSGITLTDITLPDGDGVAFGEAGAVDLRNAPQVANKPDAVAYGDLVLYAEGGDGVRLRAFGPLESLANGITNAAFLNRLALSSVYDSAYSFPSNPGDEIRGQRVKIPEPDSVTLLCFGLAVLALSRLFRRSSARAFIYRPRSRRTGPKPSRPMCLYALEG